MRAGKVQQNVFLLQRKIELGKRMAEVWLEQAIWDLRAAEHSVKIGFNEWSCFQAEQSAEKALKAIIVSTGKKAPPIHKLSVLIGIVKKEKREISQQYIDISTLQAFTFIARYPFLLPGEYQAPHNYITEKEAKQCIKEAWKVIELTKNLLKN